MAAERARRELRAIVDYAFSRGADEYDSPQRGSRDPEDDDEDEDAASDADTIHATQTDTQSSSYATAQSHSMSSLHQQSTGSRSPGRNLLHPNYEGDHSAFVPSQHSTSSFMSSASYASAPSRSAEEYEDQENRAASVATLQGRREQYSGQIQEQKLEGATQRSRDATLTREREDDMSTEGKVDNASSPAEDTRFPASLGRSNSVFRRSSEASIPPMDETAQKLTEIAAPEPLLRTQEHRDSHEMVEEVGGLTDLMELSQTAQATEEPVKGNEDGRSKEEDLEVAEQAAQRNAASSNGRSQHSHIATEIYIWSNLIFFSLLGALARLGLQWLTFYPGAPVSIDNVWANFAGTLFMGFLSEDRKLFLEEWGEHRQNRTGLNSSWSSEQMYRTDNHDRGSKEARSSHSKVKKTIPLYIGLSTGFCGTFTSFSSFMRDAFFAVANELPAPISHFSDGSSLPSPNMTVPRNNAYSVNAVLAVLILNVGLSFAGLFLGAHIAIGLDRLTPILPFRLVRRFLDPLIVFLAAGCWIGSIVLAIFPPDRPGGPSSRGSWSNETWRGEVLFAITFAPVGCLIRYYLAKKLNSILPQFPLGTFAANVFGTAIIAMSLDFQHVPLASTGAAAGIIGGGRVPCQVLQGVEDGFCGALTTVSTWILELSGLRLRHAYIYGLVSVSVAFGLIVIISGSVLWSIGWEPIACVTSNS